MAWRIDWALGCSMSGTLARMGALLVLLLNSSMGLANEDLANETALTTEQMEAGFWWQLPIPEQGPTTLKGPLASTAAASCGLCHVKQYTQWRGSLHAQALGPGLLGQLPLFDSKTIVDCLNCHVPRLEQQNRVFAWLDAATTPSTSVKAGGVDCAGCHLRAHQRYGPRAIVQTPHGPVKAIKVFNQAAFCAPCHQFGEEGIRVNGRPLENTVAEWQASTWAAQGITCQNCHMRNGEHRFRGIHDAAMVREGLAVSAHWSGKDLEVTLTNQGAGHALPSYVTPRIRIFWRSDGGTVSPITQLQRLVHWDADNGWRELSDTRLLPAETRHVSLELPGRSSGWVEVWVDPDTDYAQRVYPAILDAMNTTPHPQAAKAMIEKALNQAQASSYRLLRLRCLKENDDGCL